MLSQVCLGGLGQALDNASNRRGGAALFFDQRIQASGEVRALLLSQGIGQDQRSAKNDFEVAPGGGIAGPQGNGLAKPVGGAFEVGQGRFGRFLHGGIRLCDFDPAQVEGGAIAQLAVASGVLAGGLKQAVALLESVGAQGRKAAVIGFPGLFGDADAFASH